MSNVISQHSVGHWSLGQRATLAITLEASARKAGNVHPEAHFSDMRFEHFLRSAIAIAPCFDRRGKLTTGRLVYQAIEATQQAVGVNTNLGTILLMAPIATALRNVAPNESTKNASPTLARLRHWTEQGIDKLTASDSRWIYAAIRLAAPGGLGRADKLDVNESAAPPRLLEAMQVVKDIDWVAKIYCSRFHALFDQVVPALSQEIRHYSDIAPAIRIFQIRWLAQHGDSLVLRKLGERENSVLMDKAQRLLDTLEQDDRRISERFEKQWNSLDRWLRSDGHRRNPGTTADLIAAALFALLCCQ